MEIGQDALQVAARAALAGSVGEIRSRLRAIIRRDLADLAAEVVAEELAAITTPPAAAEGRQLDEVDSPPVASIRATVPPAAANGNGGARRCSTCTERPALPGRHECSTCKSRRQRERRAAPAVATAAGAAPAAPDSGEPSPALGWKVSELEPESRELSRPQQRRMRTWSPAGEDDERRARAALIAAAPAHAEERDGRPFTVRVLPPVFVAPIADRTLAAD